MSTTELKRTVREASRILPGARLWPNDLGFDTRGANGHTFEVWYPIGGMWRTREFDDAGYPLHHGTGPSVLVALAECVQEVQP